MAPLTGRSTRRAEANAQLRETDAEYRRRLEAREARKAEIEAAAGWRARYRLRRAKGAHGKGRRGTTGTSMGGGRR